MSTAPYLLHLPHPTYLHSKDNGVLVAKYRLVQLAQNSDSRRESKSRLMVAELVQHLQQRPSKNGFWPLERGREE